MLYTGTDENAVFALQLPALLIANDSSDRRRDVLPYKVCASLALIGMITAFIAVLVFLLSLGPAAALLAAGAEAEAASYGAAIGISVASIGLAGALADAEHFFGCK